MSERVWCGVVAMMCVASGCGEELPDPRSACESEGFAMYGAVTLDGAETRHEGAEGDGLFQASQMYVRLPGVDGPQVILRTYASDGTQTLLERVARDIDGGSVSLTVVDATDPGAGSMNVSGLDRYSCNYEGGEICAQIVLDGNGDGLVSDDDEVFNARSGTLRFTELSGLPNRIALDWTLELGGDVTAGGEGGGSSQGCVDTGYETGGGGNWLLK